VSTRTIYSCYQDLNWNDEALKKCCHWDEPLFYCEMCCNYTLCSQLREIPMFNLQDDLDALFDEIFENDRRESWSDNLEHEWLPF
jgi:hypothetical protein